jgi:hypothetical protein
MRHFRSNSSGARRRQLAKAPPWVGLLVAKAPPWVGLLGRVALTSTSASARRDVSTVMLSTRVISFRMTQAVIRACREPARNKARTAAQCPMAAPARLTVEAAWLRTLVGGAANPTCAAQQTASPRPFPPVPTTHARYRAAARFSVGEATRPVNSATVPRRPAWYPPRFLGSRTPRPLLPVAALTLVRY